MYPNQNSGFNFNPGLALIQLWTTGHRGVITSSEAQDRGWSVVIAWELRISWHGNSVSKRQKSTMFLASLLLMYLVPYCSYSAILRPNFLLPNHHGLVEASRRTMRSSSSNSTKYVLLYKHKCYIEFLAHVKNTIFLSVKISFVVKRIATDVLLFFTEFCLCNKQKNAWVLGNTRFISRVELTWYLTRSLRSLMRMRYHVQHSK
jgi:hypothetical protein